MDSGVYESVWEDAHVKSREEYDAMYKRSIEDPNGSVPHPFLGNGPGPGWGGGGAKGHGRHSEPGWPLGKRAMPVSPG